LGAVTPRFRRFSANRETGAPKYSRSRRHPGLAQPFEEPLPDGWSFKEVGAVGVDNKDNVYVFNRGDHPVMVFDRGGNFLRSWGEGQYPRAHGVHMGPDDSIYLTDDGGHFMRKCSLDGHGPRQ